MTFHWNLGECHEQLHQHKDALISYMDSLENARKIPGQDINQALLMMNVGFFFNILGDFGTAEAFLKPSCEILQNIGSSQDIFHCLLSLASCYQYQGHYEKSIEIHKQSLEILEPNDDTIGKKLIGDAYNNMANTYHLLKDYESALNFYQKSLEKNKEILSATHPSLAATFLNIGNIHYENGNLNLALSHYKGPLSNLRAAKRSMR